MERGIIRNAGLSLALCASLGWAACTFTTQPALADELQAAASAGVAADSASVDGTYTGEGKGIGGALTVDVTFEGGVITAVVVGENSETQGIGTKAIEQLPEAIVAANGTAGVDAVSGATITSNAIFDAVADCLEQAAGAPVADAEADAAEGEDEKDDGAAAAGEIAVAEGLSAEDAAAVEEGKTVKIIGQYYTNLREAVEVANQNGGGTITLLADTVATDDSEDSATIGFRTSIMIKSEGDVPLRIYRAEGQTGAMLVITDGTVNLKNVTVDASGEEAVEPAVMISDQAHVKFNKGFTITGNVTDGTGNDKLPASAASISGSDAVLTLVEGCVISGNEGTGSVVAALYNDGATVENEGATFRDNTAESGDNPNYAGDGKFKGDELGAE